MRDRASPKLVIPILSVSNFVIGMGAFVVIGLINPIADDFGLSTSGAGWALTFYALGYAVLSPLLVSWTGGVGRRRVLAIGLSIFATAHLLSALAPSPAALNITRIMAAAGAGMFTPIAASVAAGLSAPERQGRALAAVFFGLTLAQVLGVPAGSFLAYTFGWRTAFGVVAVLALPCIVLIWVFIPKGLAFQTISLRDLGQTLVDVPIMLAVLFTTSFLGAIYVLFTYLTPLLSQSMGYGRNGITAILLIFGIGAVVGNIVGGMLADKIGATRSLMGLCVAQVTIMPLFSMLPVTDAVLVGFVLVWSTCGWSFMASQQVRLIAIAPDRIGVVLALNAAAIYVGVAVGSAIGGRVLDIWDVNTLGMAGGALGIIAVLHIILSRKISGI